MADSSCEPAPCATPNGALEDLAALAAALLGAEIAIISQRDAAGYRCAARFGTHAHLIEFETFCAPLANDPAPLLTTDTRLSARLAVHSNVAGAPHVASTLSVPILSGSLGAIGAVCVMTLTPRAWIDAEVAAVRQIASIAGGLIHGGTVATAMDTANDGIGIADASGVFTYMNQAHARQFGYDDVAELIGKPWMVLYEPEHAERIAAAAMPTLARDGVWTGEAIGRRRDGSLLFQEMTLSALPSGGTICATRDISERKRLEARSLKLAEMRASAEAASAAKSAFLAQMSHEIRTPLNGVVGLVGALRDTVLSPEQDEIVSLIESCSETLDHLVSDILDLSRIEAGKIKFDVSPFDLASVAGGAVNIVAPAANAKRIRLETRFEGSARDGAFIGDAVRIKQLLLNLVSNALKFTAAGAVRVRVSAPPDLEVGARGEVVIEVKDTGIGFDEGEAARLFRRFEQADDCIARTYGGTGLGLSICQALAEGMGGRITCTTAVGAGSTFTVMLPLERAPPRASAAPTTTTSRRGLRVLVAEDHLANRRVVEIILSAAGANLTFATNGLEAVEARRVGDFDVVLMDMLMPVMSGLEAIAAIRALERRENLPRIPIAVLSANVVERQRELALRAGADMYLPKPITPASLLAAIERLLRSAIKAA